MLLFQHRKTAVNRELREISEEADREKRRREVGGEMEEEEDSLSPVRALP